MFQVKPTIDDLRAAQDKFETEQKRIDREYDEWAEDKLKWAEIRKRRMKNFIPKDKAPFK